MVSKIVSVSVDERLVWLVPKLNFVFTLAEALCNLMGSIKQPKSDRKEHQLNEILNKEIVIDQQISSKELRPRLQFCLLNLIQEGFDSGESCQVEEEQVKHHEQEVPIENRHLSLRLCPEIFHLNHHINEERNENNRYNHSRKRGEISTDIEPA